MCEDYPCCGHEPGGCPVLDEQGRSCFPCARCGAIMPPTATSAVCRPCHADWARRDEDPTGQDSDF